MGGGGASWTVILRVVDPLLIGFDHDPHGIEIYQIREDMGAEHGLKVQEAHSYELSLVKSYMASG